MAKKGKNYAELENARVFHNPKTDLIEITGKYVDGGNFSVVLPKGTKSDEKVRAEISTKDSLLDDVPDPTRGLPATAKIVYDPSFNEPLDRDGKIWREKDNEHKIVYLPFTESEKPSKFPLGIDMDSLPVLIDLHGTKRKNLFIAAPPGSGGSMLVYNLAFHVLHEMTDTRLISNSPSFIETYRNSDAVESGNAVHLKGLGLLEHLRELHAKMIKSPHGCAGVNEVILMEHFEEIINGNISNGPSSRTDKAVRAETLDLIVEISKIDRSEFNVNFVFGSYSLGSNMDAFIDTCHTFLVLGRSPIPAAELTQRHKMFGRDLHELNSSHTGDGYIKDEGVYKDGEFFASFLNQEVIDIFNPSPNIQKKLMQERAKTGL